MRSVLRWRLDTVFAAATLAACAASPAGSEPGPHSEPRDPLTGMWSMVTEAGPNGIPTATELSRDGDGALSGTWSSQGQLMDLSNLNLDGSALSSTAPTERLTTPSGST